MSYTMSEAALRHRREQARLRAERAYREAMRGAEQAADFCKRGHPFTEANTYRRPSGSRQCRICRRDEQWWRRRGRRLTEVEA